MRELEIELTRMAVQLLVLQAIGIVLGMWVLYLVIRYAIRDGINDSKIANNWRRQVEAAEANKPDDLPPMRAER